MSGTRAEDIFEELKKVFEPGSIWQKVLVHQHDLLKSFGTPTAKLKIAQKVSCNDELGTVIPYLKKMQKIN